MARGPRKKSESGIYHVILRGIDKRDLFISAADYEKFLSYIEKAKEKSVFAVYAYCLMSNHVHLLLKTEAEEIGNVMRMITVGYAQYHNIKHGRTGHLFQNRFKSEAVDDDKYFLTVLRYIHQNPVKAGIVDNIANYKWSSYHEYNTSKAKLVNASFALSFFADIQSFKEFMSEKNDTECLEYDSKVRYSDEALKNFIATFSTIDNLQRLGINSRNEELKMIKEKTGASNRQLSRVLNVGRGILEKVK